MVIRIFFKKTKDEGEEVQTRWQEMEEEISPVAVAADESGHESNTASSAVSGW